MFLARRDLGATTSSSISISPISSRFWEKLSSPDRLHLYERTFGTAPTCPVAEL